MTYVAIFINGSFVKSHTFDMYHVAYWFAAGARTGLEAYVVSDFNVYILPIQEQEMNNNEAPEECLRVTYDAP